MDHKEELREPNMDVVYDEPVESSKCGDCNKCVKSCSALALRGGLWYPCSGREELVEAQLVVSICQPTTKIWRGSVYGICIKNCPKGTKGIR